MSQHGDCIPLYISDVAIEYFDSIVRELKTSHDPLVILENALLQQHVADICLRTGSN